MRWPAGGRALAGGVTSSWQITAPQPVWLSHGRGSKIYDVDGNEYVDLHGGYGAGLAGPCAPGDRGGGTRQVAQGTHFAQPTPDAVVVAGELAAPVRQPLWRFGNSGTEATMDAIHLMRAITGRDMIIKVEGCYHGHHDSVQVSVVPEADEAARKPAQVSASSSGIPGPIIKLTLVASFNDLDSVARLLDEHPDEIAGMIIEPIMMNAGIIHPEPGYLGGAAGPAPRARRPARPSTRSKTGLTAGPGGVTGLTGVQPDITCLAKAIGGGAVAAAIGGTAEVMEHVAAGTTRWWARSTGTHSRWPPPGPCSRGRHPEAYRGSTPWTARPRRIEREIAAAGLAAHVVTAGAKGCVVFSPQPVRDYRDFLGIDDRYSHAHWLFQHNGGVFLPPWGKIEQWLISVQHDERTSTGWSRTSACLPPRRTRSQL